MRIASDMGEAKKLTGIITQKSRDQGKTSTVEQQMMKEGRRSKADMSEGKVEM